MGASWETCMGNNTEKLTLISWKEEDAVKILTEPFNLNNAGVYCVIQEEVFWGYCEQREIYLSLILSCKHTRALQRCKAVMSLNHWLVLPCAGVPEPSRRQAGCQHTMQQLGTTLVHAYRYGLHRRFSWCRSGEEQCAFLPPSQTISLACRMKDIWWKRRNPAGILHRQGTVP